MAAALAACALLAAPAAAAEKDALTARSGRWVRLFAVDVERMLGYGVRVDRASIVAAGQSRRFRELTVMLDPAGTYPRGTMMFRQRSVDCARGLVATAQWQVIGPNGAAGAGSRTAGQVARIAWDTADGKVLRYVCHGVLPR